MGEPSRWHDYCVYGLSLRSRIPLRYPESARRAGEIVVVSASPAPFRKLLNGAFRQTAKSGVEHARLADGSTYLRWKGLSEFLVSADGNRITCLPLNQVSSESVHTYLLAQVLSFALLKKAIE